MASVSISDALRSERGSTVRLVFGKRVIDRAKEEH